MSTLNRICLVVCGLHIGLAIDHFDHHQAKSVIFPLLIAAYFWFVSKEDDK